MARILVVDDERDVVTLIRFLLEKEGHAVTEAHNGVEALAALGIEPVAEKPLPDLMILDLMMPVMDGLAVCAKLGQSPKAARLPVIILTAKGASAARAQESVNIVSCFEKPFEPKRLREKIAQLLTPPK